MTAVFAAIGVAVLFLGGVLLLGAIINWFLTVEDTIKDVRKMRPIVEYLDQADRVRSIFDNSPTETVTCCGGCQPNAPAPEKKAKRK